MAKGPHPTRERLIDVVVDLLKTKTTDDITVDEVLSISGISKGSLYHHFTDFDNLLDVSLARRFAAFVEVTIAELVSVTTSVTSAEAMWQGLDAITVSSQDVENRPNRLTRIQVVARASRNEAFRALLEAEQIRLTTALADLVREGQNRGWLNSDVSADAAATFVQAYTLGRVIDDLTEPHLDPTEWTSVISKAIRGVLEPKG